MENKIESERQHDMSNSRAKFLKHGIKELKDFYIPNYGVNKELLEDVKEIRKIADAILDEGSLCPRCKGEGLIKDYTSNCNFSCSGHLSTECPDCGGSGELIL